jgi:hypothetical protein
MKADIQSIVENEPFFSGMVVNLQLKERGGRKK